MCLITKQICPTKARKDIICYKIFVMGTKRCRTPVIGYSIENPHYTGVPFLMDDSDKSYHKNGSKNTLFRISKGMIHAYQNIECAKSARSTFNLYAFLKIYKCIIPKGTLYFKGINGDICSRKLLVVKRVED